MYKHSWMNTLNCFTVTLVLVVSACDDHGLEAETGAGDSSGLVEYEGTPSLAATLFDTGTNPEESPVVTVGFADDIELAPEGRFEMSPDGRAGYHVTSLSGAHALLELAEAGQVEMDPAASSHLRAFVDQELESQELCPNSGAKTSVGRLSNQYSAAYFFAIAEKGSVDFGPPRPSIGEAIVCLGSDCKKSTSGGPPLEVSVHRQVYFSDPSWVYASAKVVDGFTGCVESASVQYWGPKP